MGKATGSQSHLQWLLRPTAAAAACAVAAFPTTSLEDSR
jgi:hypothetical protein